MSEQEEKVIPVALIRLIVFFVAAIIIGAIIFVILKGILK